MKTMTFLSIAIFGGIACCHRYIAARQKKKEWFLDKDDDTFTRLD